MTPALEPGDLTDLLTPRHDRIDLSRLRRLVERESQRYVERTLRDGDVALVISEPALTNTGIVMPEPGFHEGLRALCTRYGAYLLIDETHTLSEGPRGCTGEWGLEPDFWVAGKAIASGVPCAVYGCSGEVGDRLGALLCEDDPQGVGGYFELLHLRALNRGFMIIPYYTMFLSSPHMSAGDVDLWIECFDELVADMLGSD